MSEKELQKHFRNIQKAQEREEGVYAVAREKVRETGDWKSGMAVLESHKGSSRDLAIHGERIISYLRSLGRKQKSAPTVWGLDSFGILPEWDMESFLLIWGDSGVGKTSLAHALIQEWTGYPAHMVTHLDYLRKFDEIEHGGIVFDEMNIAHLPRESQIHLVDWEFERQIHVRYKVATIPAKTPKIGTSNKSPLEIMLASDPAIFRRLTIWEMRFGDKDNFIIKLDETDYTNYYRKD